MVRGLTWSRKASTASSPPRTMRRLRPQLWEEGAQVMSEEELMLCALITEARRSDSETPVISPGGYMRGMVRAAQRVGSYRHSHLGLLKFWRGLRVPPRGVHFESGSKHEARRQ